jgi:uncharacterized linocin/CFP29 family protein
MHADLVNLGWTEEQWNRICSTVTEEAQKARVAAQVVAASGPEDPSAVAVPNFTLNSRQPNPTLVRPPPPALRFLPPARRLWVDSNPNLQLTTIAVNVQLRSHEVADPELKAALVMFRRAAITVARVEDALAFYGRPGPNRRPTRGVGGIPRVYRVTGDGRVTGILSLPRRGKSFRQVRGPRGQGLVLAIAQLIDQLEAKGQAGPFACVLGHSLFEDSVNPNANLVLPRDRILPFLQGPLLRSSNVVFNWGAVIALSGDPVELVVARDIGVQFLQTTLEPRFVFRLSERVALRIKEESAIGLLYR